VTVRRLAEKTTLIRTIVTCFRTPTDPIIRLARVKIPILRQKRVSQIEISVKFIDQIDFVVNKYERLNEKWYDKSCGINPGI